MHITYFIEKGPDLFLTVKTSLGVRTNRRCPDGPSELQIVIDDAFLDVLDENRDGPVVF